MLFGLGHYSAAAAAASSSALAAEAAAAGAAASASAWGIGTAIAGVSTAVTSAGLAAASAQTRERHLAGVAHVGGMTVIHSEAVRVKDARMALRAFKYTGTASKIKASKSFKDIVFYPDGVVQFYEPKQLGCLSFPFLLYNLHRKKYLTFDGSSLDCVSDQDRSEQLWWAVANDSDGSSFGLQNGHWLHNLRAEKSNWLSPDQRLAVRCTPEVPSQSWRAIPGTSAGTVRLQNVHFEQCLYYDGVWLGCHTEAFSDQDWCVIPKVPLYIGRFREINMCGRGQFFWPNGAPLFKGEVEFGKPSRGFVFDERCVCHGYFRFVDGIAELEGVQPDDLDWDADGSNKCLVCQDAPCMALVGKVSSLADMV